MGKIGILSSKEFIGEEKKERGGDQPPATLITIPTQGNGKVVYKAKIAAAPRGEAVTTILYKDDYRRLVLFDGIYEFPADMERGEAEAFLAFLIKKAGFTDASIRGGQPTEVTPDQPKTIAYKVGHPDAPKEIPVTGRVSLPGFDTPFDCVNGIVTTTDKKVRDGFIAKGWYDILADEEEEVKS